MTPRGRHGIAISPDGKTLVYVNDQLYLREMDTGETTALARTEGAADPFFSVDGAWIGYHSGDELRKVSVDGGLPITICEVAGFRRGSWYRDGTIVFASNDGIIRIREDGTDEELLVADEGFPLSRPSLLRDEVLLYSTISDVVARSLRTSETTNLVAGTDRSGSRVGASSSSRRARFRSGVSTRASPAF